MPPSDANDQIKPSATKHIEQSQASHDFSWSSLFSVPRPVKRIFDVFPLHTYPSNDLPINIQQARSGAGHALFVWCTEEDARDGRASFNPACFRWQLYLKSRGIEFHTVTSSNHASTSDRLPFLLVNHEIDPPWTNKDTVSSRELSQWAAGEIESWPKELDIHYDAYMSLLENEIRNAWQYHMYLTDNFDEFIVPSYISSKTQSVAVQLYSATELRNAARTELSKTSPKIDAGAIYSAAESALAALNTVMARKMRLQGGGYGDREPSLLEATLYAYLFLLLEMPAERWKDNRLPTMVRKYPELMRMERDVRTVYYFDVPMIYVRGQ